MGAVGPVHRCTGNEGTINGNHAIYVGVGAVDRPACGGCLQARSFRVTRGEDAGLFAVLDDITNACRVGGTGHVRVNVSFRGGDGENVVAFTGAKEMAFVNRDGALGVILLHGFVLFSNACRYL